MGAQSRAILKAWFETNDIPTEAQYIDLIDSFPNITDDLDSSPANIITKKVNVPTAQVLTLNSVPVEMVAAPGAGKFVQFINPPLVKMIYNSVEYADFTDLIIYGNVGTLAPIYTNSVVLTIASNVFEMFDFGAASASRYYAENQAIYLSIGDDDPIDGNSDIDVYYQYCIRTL